MATPSISAAINTYNRSEILERPFQSILQQVSPVQEIVIVDDGSTDNTSDIVQDLTERSPIPVVYVKTKNNGLPSARNMALEASRCEFVAFLDDDDYWVPEHTQRLRESVLDCDSAVLVGGRTSRLDHSQTVLTPIPEKYLGQYVSVSHNLRVRRRSPLVAPFFVPHLSTVMVSRRAALKVRFDDELRLRGDLLFVWRTGEIGDIGLDGRLHAFNDQLDVSLASTGKNTSRADEQKINIRRSYFGTRLAEKAVQGRLRNDCSALLKMRGDAYFDYAYRLACAGHRQEACRAFVHSFGTRKGVRRITLMAHIMLGR